VFGKTEFELGIPTILRWTLTSRIASKVWEGGIIKISVDVLVGHRQAKRVCLLSASTDPVAAVHPSLVILMDRMAGSVGTRILVRSIFS
jgi:hypothetical protein